jgi:hypothetical protein
MRRTRNTACTFLWQTRKKQPTFGDIAHPDSRRAYACWRWNGARQKRPMNSIVLEPAVKEMLLADCRDFLRSEDWYVYYLEFIGMRGFMWSAGTLNGVSSFDIMVVKLPGIYRPDLARYPFPTWLFVTRRAGKVRFMFLNWCVRLTSSR